MKIQTGEIWIVKLYPVRGSEMNGLRPCVVLSPNTMNNNLETVIVAPLTRTVKNWPTRINIEFNKTKGQVSLEHIRSISKKRLSKKSGELNKNELQQARKILNAMFTD